MNHTPDLPEVVIEQPARDETEAAQLAQLTELLTTTDPLLYFLCRSFVRIRLMYH